MKKSLSQLTTLAGALLLAVAASTSAIAAEGTASSTPAPATAGSPPSEAVQQALDKRMKTVLDALEGVGTTMKADMFSEEFNKQASAEQVQQAFKQLHDAVGSCKIGGRTRSSAPNGSSYLLDCQKAFVPVEIGVEDKAPYRIQSLFFPASFWRL